MPDDLHIREFLRPLSLEDFLEQYWEKTYCHFSRGEAGYYENLFSLADVDSIITLCLRGDATAFELVKAGHPRPDKDKYYVNGRPEIYRVYDSYSKGFTIVINALHLRSKQVGALCTNLQMQLRHPVTANLYLTPPQSQGFGPHFDDGDVFVLQLGGTKTWRLYDHSPISLPLRGASKLRFKEVVADKPKETMVLNTGDMLYIPRGWVHEALTSDAFSLHLSVGVDVIRWLDVLMTMLQLAAEQDPRFRQALPIGFGDPANLPVHQLVELVASVDAQKFGPKAILKTAEGLARSGQPAPDGHFVSLNQLSQINLNTTVVRRSASAVVHNSTQGTTIEFEGNTITGPEFLEPFFSYVTVTPQFKVRELPDLADDHVKIEFVRRLVREGFLAIQRLEQAATEE